VWRAWADDLRGAGIDSGHHVAEEAPEATSRALAAFWSEIGWTAQAAGTSSGRQ
jgi:haloacetate dehalogenase